MSRHTITREELEAELGRLGISQGDPDDSVRTSEEWSEHWSCSQNKALQLLKTAKGHGLIRVVYKRLRRLDDKEAVVPGYQFLNNRKGVRKK